jgi:RNA polymerase sigma factor (sigma-70 family)
MIERGEPLHLQNQRGRCEQLVSDHYDRLYRWFLWSTNSADNAADLTQDTFVALWQSLDRFDGRRPFTPWLYGIARNVWRKHSAGQVETILTMQPLYMKKLSGFTRGNIPTPDIPWPSLP